MNISQNKLKPYSLCTNSKITKLIQSNNNYDFDDGPPLSPKKEKVLLIEIIHCQKEILQMVLTEITDNLFKYITDSDSILLKNQRIKMKKSINTLTKKEPMMIVSPNKTTSSYSRRPAVALKRPLRSFYRIGKPFTLWTILLALAFGTYFNIATPDNIIKSLSTQYFNDKGENKPYQLKNLEEGTKTLEIKVCYALMDIIRKQYLIRRWHRTIRVLVDYQIASCKHNDIPDALFILFENHPLVLPKFIDIFKQINVDHDSNLIILVNSIMQPELEKINKDYILSQAVITTEEDFIVYSFINNKGTYPIVEVLSLVLYTALIHGNLERVHAINMKHA